MLTLMLLSLKIYAADGHTAEQSRAEPSRAVRRGPSQRGRGVGRGGTYCSGGGSSRHPLRGWHRQVGVAQGGTQACIFLENFETPTTSEDLCGSLNNSHRQPKHPHTHTHQLTINTHTHRLAQSHPTMNVIKKFV